MTKFRIGHTGITWGYSPDTAAEAVKDVAELGYRAYETIAGIIERYEEQYGEGFDALLARYGIPLSGTYLPVRFESPDQTRQDVEQAIVWAKRAKELGATTVIVQAGSRLPEPFTEYDKMAEAFNEVGRRVMNLGMIAVIHPHTGTLVETRAEIDAILTRINSDLIGFGPDTGQIAKGGADPVATLRDYQSIIRLVHLKDYGGGRETGYHGYEPIGSGVIDFPAIFQILEDVNFDGWVDVELDSSKNPPRPPREAAAMSKRYLEELLGDKADW